MTNETPAQRFCPLCNRPFAPREAVLRCEGCGVMHHPGCWVTNGGCATQSPHKVAPVAMAYEAGAPASPPAPHPGEGTRLASPSDSPGQQPIRFEPRPRAGGPPIPPETGAGAPVPVIGADEPTPPHPAAPKRYAGPATEHPSLVKSMPSIYNRHRILGYWYVPAAILVVAVVAFGVVWLAEQLRGNGSSDTSITAGTAQPGAALTATASAAAQAAGTPLPSGTANPTAKFKAGDTATVTGTGDCLNVRSAPSRSGDPIACLADGTTVTILDGPQAGDQLTWWKIHTARGDGWAAEDYLKKG